MSESVLDGLSMIDRPEHWSVLSIVPMSSGLWLATDSGLRRWDGERWHGLPSPSGLDFVAVLAALNNDADTQRLIIAAGLPAGIVYSLDGGQRWSAAVVDSIDSSISCLVASPRFAHDRVLLAGTEHDGMLRSNDGGRHWRLANFGLTEFTILALAVAPAWDRSEDLFMATDGGLYRSPNGGRAWKRADAGLEGCIVQALACSPNYASDQSVFAGCEGAPIQRSSDAGRSWQALAAPEHVNSLWIHPTDPAVMVAGTGEGLIVRSADSGNTWTQVFAGNDAILTLSASESMLYAGRYGGGLLCSPDSGISWVLHTSMQYE